MKKQKSLPPDRQRVLEKIAEYEKKGGEYFFMDVEDDPPEKELAPSDVDYLHKSFAFKWHGFWARLVEQICKLHYKRKFHMVVTGKEHLEGVDRGAVFTSNHFSMYENIAVKLASESVRGQKKRLYKLVRQGNYSIPGFIGWLLRYCDTLPLSSSPATMKQLNKAVAEILKRGDHLLIYPEQSMWWNYEKPRPYMIGAFYFAAKNGVPTVPCFVTQHRKPDSRRQPPFDREYHMHILEPIFPDPALTVRQNAERMMEENYRQTKELYERVYRKPLRYGEE